MIEKLLKKQQNLLSSTINLIASNNLLTSKSFEVLKEASILNGSYAEGYPNKRYYNGTSVIDEIESYAIEQCKKLFNCKYANVQPHSGSSANMAAIKSILNTEDTILGMNLDDGGHLTHGSKVSFSGKDYYSYSYGLDERGNIDYADIENKLTEHNPTVLVVGASSYSGKIDFERIRTIVDFYNSNRKIEYYDPITNHSVYNQEYCYILADIAHIAGLVVAGLHQSPIEYADIVTSTTHKTLRGPRGGIIMTNNEELAKKINKSVFPGIQGGPLLQMIAAKGQCFEEALSDNFKKYQYLIIENIKSMKEVFDEYELIS